MGSVATGAVAGANVGGAILGAVPGIGPLVGTAVGAGVGGLVGAAAGASKNNSRYKKYIKAQMAKLTGKDPSGLVTAEEEAAILAKIQGSTEKVNEIANLARARQSMALTTAAPYLAGRAATGAEKLGREGADAAIKASSAAAKMTAALKQQRAAQALANYEVFAGNKARKAQAAGAASLSAMEAIPGIAKELESLSSSV